VRNWRVDAIRTYLSSVRSDWRRDDEFSMPGVDIWLRHTPDRYLIARLAYYPAAAGRPAITPEPHVITFCHQLDIEPRLLFDALGAEGQYAGPLP
jgi:hypothetical protein